MASYHNVTLEFDKPSGETASLLKVWVLDKDGSWLGMLQPGQTSRIRGSTHRSGLHLKIYIYAQRNPGCYQVTASFNNTNIPLRPNQDTCPKPWTTMTLYTEDFHIDQDGTVRITLDRQSPTQTPQTGTLRISTTPTGATASIQGQTSKQTPATYTLQPGTYTVTITKQGYQQTTRQVTITSGQTTNLNVTLTQSQPQSQQMTVNITKHEQGGITISKIKYTQDGGNNWITINGNSITLPRNTETFFFIERTSINPSCAYYLVKANNQELQFWDYQEGCDRTTGNGLTIDRLPDADTINLDITVSDTPITTQPSTKGMLRISTTPTGATASIQGQTSKQTPATYTLPPGTYTVTITKQGYKQETRQATITSGQTTNLNITLQQTPTSGGGTTTKGTLKIYSTPTGATVSIQGQTSKQTPATYTLPPGTYTVTITKQGYKQETRQATITSGQTTNLNITLQQTPTTTNTANIWISSIPVRAKIYIDGVYKHDLTPARSKGYDVTPGRHTIKLTLAGYQDYTETVNLSAGQKYSKTVTLQHFTPTISRAVRINEFMPAPARGQNEWIELHNSGTTPVDLRGWTLEDANGRPKKITGTIPANGRLVIQKGRGGFGFALNNKGDIIKLKAGNTLIDQVYYGDKSGQTTNTADRAPEPRQGYSIGRYPDGTGAWSIMTPTPGQPNQKPPTIQQASIVINEIDPYNEWIELKNLDNKPVNLWGWTLEDSRRRPELITGTIPANGRLVLEKSQGDYKFALNNTGDTVTLRRGTTQVDSITYGRGTPAGRVRRGQTLARIPDGTGAWTVTNVPTKGTTNQT